MSSIIADLSGSKKMDKYRVAGKYTFPAYEEIDPKEKEKPEYCIKVAQAAFSNLMRDRTSLPSDYYSYIQLMRDYGSGNQSWRYYSNRFKESSPRNDQTTSTRDSSNVDEIKRKGDQNISHKIVSIAPNMKNAIHGMFETYEEDVFVNSIDNESGAEEERQMYEMLFKTQLGKFTKAMQQEYNLPIHEETGVPEDISVEELEAYKETGGFKTAWAEAMEELVAFTERFSNWDRVLKRKFIDDALDINFCAAKVSHDFSSGKERWDYVDPANFAIQYSNERLFDDAEYAGEFTLEKIGSLIEMGFSKEDLIKAARHYEYLFDNPRDVDWGVIERTHTISGKIYDFKVPVFHFQWIDVDVKRGLQVTNKYDKTFTYDLEFDKKVKPLSDYKKRNGTSQKELRSRLKKTRQCSWIVDTDLIYYYGTVPNQSRKSKREAKLSYCAWRGISTNRNMILGSIIESVVPFLDHLQIAWTKYQDAMVKSHPGGYKINLRLLQNLKLGGKKLDPLDAYVMFWDKGVMPYMDVPMGESYRGGDVSPVSRIEGTQGELMSVIQAEIAFVIQMIERITGINPTTVGSSPDASQPVSTTQMALAGTSNVLKPIINGIFEIKERLAEETSLRLPILMRNVKESREAYSRIVGKDSVDVIVEAERHGAEYGLYMEARPDGQEKQDLIIMVQEAMKRGRDGEASVNIGQGFYVIERIKNGGNFKKLQRQVDMMVRKAEEEAFAKKRILIAEQNQQQAQIAQAQQQGKMQEKQQDTQIQIAVDNNQSNNDMKLKNLEFNLDLKKLLYEKRLDILAEREKQQRDNAMKEREIQAKQQEQEPQLI